MSRSLAERVAISPVGKPAAALWRSRAVKAARLSRARDPRNNALHGRHAGKRCFIIGNGPSILNQDLTVLRDEVTFVLNSFFHHEDFHAIAPTYLCSLDSLTVDTDYRTAWEHLQRERDTSNTVKLFAKTAEGIDRRLGLFSDHEVHYLYASSPLLPPLWDLQVCPTDLSRPLSGHGLVLTDIALQAAYAMGVSRIYLLGFDANPIRSVNEYVNYNFYGRDPLIPLAVYRRDYERFHAPTSNFDASREGLGERSTACLERTFAATGVEVLNVTHGGGELPGFRRVRFEEALATPG